MFASLLLAGCGGGGGNTIATTSSGSSGSGSTSTSGSGSSSTTAYNVVNATVDQGPTGLAAANEAAVNIMYVNVTICVPGSTTNCQTIDHVQVDTGSQGLRILASVVNSSLLSALSPVTVNGGALAECTQFVDGYSWGPIVTAAAIRCRRIVRTVASTPLPKTPSQLLAPTASSALACLTRTAGQGVIRP
jgi:hypothetical protein